MTLEVYEQTVRLPLGKRIHAGFDRLADNRVSALRQFVLAYFVPSRVRESNQIGVVSRQQMMGRFREIKNTKSLVVESVSLNPVAVQHTSVRRQTRQNCRECIAFGPLQKS